MNWYKFSQRKTLEDLIKMVKEDLQVDRGVVSFILNLPREEMGPAINFVLKNKKANLESIRNFVKELKPEPLNEEEKELVSQFKNEIGAWMSKVLLNLKGTKRIEAYNLLKENIYNISDWVYVTESKIKGYTLKDAIAESEKWHNERNDSHIVAYSPTKEENILIKYPNGWTWQKVVGSNDIKFEGKKMNHCVGNFCSSVAKDQVVVYSLRDQENNPQITAGFKYGGLVVFQMRGYDNGVPQKENTPYVKDILEKLGTKYNQNEYALKEFSNLKNFNDLSFDTIEEDPLLYQIVTNIVLSGTSNIKDPVFNRYIYWKFESDAPKEWEKAVKSKISSIIKKYENISKQKKPESPAENFLRIDDLKQGSTMPHWAHPWIENKLLTGKAPQEWKSYINSLVAETGFIPDWADSWARTELERNGMPESWAKKVNEIVLKSDGKDNKVPRWAWGWVRSVASSDNPPKEWEEQVLVNSHNQGLIPGWGVYIMSSKLRKEKLPLEWQIATYNVAKNGVRAHFGPPGIATREDYDTLQGLLMQRLMRSKNKWYQPSLLSRLPQEVETTNLEMPEYWIKNIFLDVLDGKSSTWADAWIEKILLFGTPPKEWTDLIDYRIRSNGEVPSWGFVWAKRKLVSEEPEKWVDAVGEWIEKNGEPPHWAREWIDVLIKGKKLPVEWANRMSAQLVSLARTKYKASQWLLDRLSPIAHASSTRMRNDVEDYYD